MLTRDGSLPAMLAGSPRALACSGAVALPTNKRPDILARVLSKNERELRLRQLVDSHVPLVARILRNAGTADADIDDDVQRVFITLSNRLDDVRVGAEKSFLVQTALHMAAHIGPAAERHAMPGNLARDAGAGRLADARRRRQVEPALPGGIDERFGEHVRRGLV